MGQLDGKVAVVTGAAQGIGNAIAAGLAAEGARIVVADLQGAEAAANAFADGIGLTADVADEGAVTDLVEKIVAQFGTVDILVNNAGLYASLEMRPFTEIPLEEWRQVMDVNVASMFLMSSSTASRPASRCRRVSRRTRRWSRSCATCRSPHGRSSATRCRRTWSAQSSTFPDRDRVSSPGRRS
jgi:NAD(P)-dependent dehydrogenase (short-subunit alcohol dehydrogenase family)